MFGEMVMASNVTSIEEILANKYNPHFIMNNRPSDEGEEIITWLKSFGLKPHLDRRFYDNFIHACLVQVFNGIELKFTPVKQHLKVVGENAHRTYTIDDLYHGQHDTHDVYTDKNGVERCKNCDSWEGGLYQSDCPNKDTD